MQDTERVSIKNIHTTSLVTKTVSDESENPVGGRVALGIVGVIVFILGAATLSLTTVYPSMAGLETYGLGGAFGAIGVLVVLVAVLNPEAPDIGTSTKVSKAEMQERRQEDPIQDE